MRRGWLVVALLLSLGVNLGLAGTALARRAEARRWHFGSGADAPLPERLGHRLAERLQLPPERRERFVDAHRRLVERTFAERREVGRLRHELRRELLAPQPDRAHVDALLGEIATREDELNRAFATSILESRALLDDRELEGYLRILERVAPGRRGPHGGGPPGRGSRRGRHP